jgi:hypothetical protein
MELRSRRKNDPSPARDMSLRILLASIGLAIYASVLEAQSISIDKLAECSDERIRALTKASAEERAQMRRSAREYVARHKAGADPQKQLELDMMSGEFFDDDEEPMDFGGLDLQAEIDALKSDGLFGGGSPSQSQASEDLSEDSDSDSDSDEDIAPAAPPVKPQPKKKQAPKQSQKRAKEDAASKQAAAADVSPGSAQKGGKGGKGGKGNKGGKGGKGGKSDGAGAKSKGGDPSDKMPKSQPSVQPESKRQSKRKKKGDDKSKKLDASSPDAPMPYSEKLRTLCRPERVIPTLKAIRTVVSMLFMFYCANWGIAACVRWIEYSTSRSMQLSNWFLKKMLMFAMPRPPLYPVPLYLCCNALLEVLEMWAKQTGRFAEGSPISVKVIGISLHACDIGAVLYGGCFLLTGTTHCLALATGKPFEEYLVRCSSATFLFCCSASAHHPQHLPSPCPDVCKVAELLFVFSGCG